MAAYDLIVRSARVVLADGQRPAAVCVRDGRVAAVEAHDTPSEAASVTELGDVALLPGLVDTHVHVNEPGRTEWEGFATASAAAAAGGITTIIDMPLNSVPPTVDVAALEMKRAAARGRCHVDVGFWGGAVPGNVGDLGPLHERGVFGFKCFLADSGVPEFPPLDGAGLRAAMHAVDALFVVHAEDPSRLLVRPPERDRPAGEAAPSRRYADFEASRPPDAEASAVRLALAAARDAGARVHILHLSAGSALELLAQAKARGERVSAETCPHYLALCAEEIADGATPFKCCPPIRSRANQEQLWQGLASGVLDCVVSDHSPCPAELKRLDLGDFAAAWGGISSLQLSLPVVWTQARARGFGLTDVVRWMASAPADLVGLAGKGRLRVGADADLVAFDPEASFTVDPSALRHRHPVTPYAGQRLDGVVTRTWLRGVPLDTTAAPQGRLLVRSAS